jgi:hypothetical protein
MKALYPKKEKKKQVAASCVALFLDRANLLAPISLAAKVDCTLTALVIE